jgi:hypothetical protein
MVPLTSKRWRLLVNVPVSPSGRNPSVIAMEETDTSVPKYDLAEYDQLSVGIPTNGIEMLESNRMTCPIVKVRVVGSDGVNDGSGDVRVPTMDREVVLFPAAAYARTWSSVMVPARVRLKDESKAWIAYDKPDSAFPLLSRN